MKRFDGRVAIVTGGARGIGKGIVKKLAEEGGTVAIFDVNQSDLEMVEKEFHNQGYPVSTYVVNVADSVQVESAVNSIAEKHGRVDILVNNAGVVRDNLIYKMTDEDWKTVIDVHLTGSFNCSRSVQKYMVKQKYGRIVNISSGSALGNRGQSNYAAAKAGMIGLAKTLAIELGKYGITVNVVAPGFVETEMTKLTAERIGIPFEYFVGQFASRSWVGRSGKPADIAEAVAFFSSEGASYVNGQVLYVDGGLHK